MIAYGACILAFGIVLILSLGQPVTAEVTGANWFAIGCATLTLVGSGAADNVSMIYRNTMLLVAMPDNMRGRMEGIFTVVVSGGPRVGDLYIGLAALGAVLWFPPVLGGLLIITLAALLLRFQPTFRHYDALEPTP